MNTDRLLLVYVAGPITQGCLVDNVRRAHDAAAALWRAGLVAITPQGSCFYNNDVEGGRFKPHADTPELGIGYADWLRGDFEIVRRCDALLRLSGPSRGADTEEAEARRVGLPVFASVEEVVNWSATATSRFAPAVTMTHAFVPAAPS